MRRRTARGPVGPYAPVEPVRRLTVMSTDGSPIHTEIHGPEDAPAVVLSHGWTCSTRFWAPVIRQLAADHRVIAYDQRGHGRSPAAGPGGCSTHALAEDLAAVLTTTLAPGERAVLAGHSMGAMTVLAAADRPALREHAAAVLLCSTGASRLPQTSTVWPLPEGRVRTLLNRLMLHSRAPLGPVTPPARKAVRYVTMGRHADPAAIDAAARLVHACPRGVRADWGRVLARLDLDAGAASLTVPTLVVQGTADRLTPIRHAHRLAALLPECVGLVELSGLGHMTPLEDPAAISGGIRGLVRDHLTAAPAAPTAEAAEATDDTKERTA
ncbi:alpha/beta fold hydrolase [Streptomyces palmae]|uniref:Alpha/beta hydrolase n=1 Tax=Streptomyces palmae TaxID=1701085 RepID=A0A4Z0FMK0_9ACTN|nr:alpha/beta hydrolase [Streptomyces palmae]TGA84122.1 alpha/beta hydrolase [Streptomyces palmae]